MRIGKARYAIAAMVTGGFAVSAGLFGSGTASADLIDDVAPLLISSCSFDQIDAALHDTAPDAAARLDAAPFQKAVLRFAFTQPAEKREAVFGQLTSQRQRIGAMTGIRPGNGPASKPEAGAELRKVADTCHNY